VANNIQSKIDALVARAQSLDDNGQPTEEARTSAYLALKLMKQHGGSIQLGKNCKPAAEPAGGTAQDAYWRGVRDDSQKMWDAEIEDAFRRWSDWIDMPPGYAGWSTRPNAPEQQRYANKQASMWIKSICFKDRECWGCKRPLKERVDTVYMKVGREPICGDCWSEEAT
jgi:hypothetical protein